MAEPEPQRLILRGPSDTSASTPSKVETYQIPEIVAGWSEQLTDAANADSTSTVYCELHLSLAAWPLKCLKLLVCQLTHLPRVVPALPSFSIEVLDLSGAIDGADIENVFDVLLDLSKLPPEKEAPMSVFLDVATWLTFKTASNSNPSPPMMQDPSIKWHIKEVK